MSETRPVIEVLPFEVEFVRQIDKYVTLSLQTLRNMRRVHPEMAEILMRCESELKSIPMLTNVFLTNLERPLQDRAMDDREGEMHVYMASDAVQNILRANGICNVHFDRHEDTIIIDLMSENIISEEVKLEITKSLNIPSWACLKISQSTRVAFTDC